MSTPNQENDAPHGDDKKQPTMTAYDLRDQVSQCNDSDLTTLSKLLFCRLTDMAFRSEFKRGDGVIECSKKFLASYFGCSPDTILRATKLLIKTGFIWTKNRWTGAHEMTWWYIRDWADPKFEHDKHTGSNFGRRVSGVQRNTLRGQKGKFAVNPDSQMSQFRAWKAAQRKASTVKAAISPDHGKESALPGLTSQPGQDVGISPDSTVNSALTAPTNQPGQDGQMPGLDTLKDDQGEVDKELPKRSTGLNALKAGGTGKKANPATVFLECEVKRVMDLWRPGHGKVELSGSGVWWRRAFEKDRELIRKVLADTERTIKDGKIKDTPGAHAVDYWKRLNGGSLSEEAAR